MGLPKKRKEDFGPKINLNEKMAEIRKLHRIKEEMQNLLMSLNSECEVLSEILICDSIDDLDVIEPLGDHREPELLSEDSAQTLKNKCSNFNQLTLHQLMGVEVEKRENGLHIIEFIPPDGCGKLEPALISLEEKDNKYRLRSHTLPPVVPISALAKKYFDSAIISNTCSFCYEIQEFLFYYWSRYLTSEKLKKRNYMKGSIVYASTDVTTLSFSLTFQSDEYIEYRLKYDPLSILPYDVSYVEIEKKSIDRELQNHLKSLTSELKQICIIDVLDRVLGATDTTTTMAVESSEKPKGMNKKERPPAEHFSLYVPSDSSASSVETVVFDIF